MPYVSCSYAPPDPTGMPEPAEGQKRIICMDDNNPPQTWWLTEDSQVGDYLAFLEAGGTIDPAEEIVQPDLDMIDARMIEEAVTSEGSFTRAIAMAQFQLLNEVRQGQGKPPLTAQQYKAHLKGLMRD